MESWELTDEEIRNEINHGATVETNCRFVATAAVKKYQEWLAKQRGEKPTFTQVELKEAFGFDIRLCAEAQCSQVLRALEYSLSKGQQQGYAKGRKEREQEIVEWLRQQAIEDASGETVTACQVAQRLEAWLKEG